MSDCIFCKIVAGEIPSHKVFENDAVFAFLDIAPLAEAHTLLVPRRHVTQLDQLTADESAAIGAVLPKLAAAVQKITGAAGYNILQNNGECAGQVVMHVHFHIIPRNGADGLGFRWHPTKYAPGRDKAVLAELQSALKN